MSAPAPRRNVALGILLVARGRADGLAQFGNTPQSLLAALAPLAAILLVGLAVALLNGSFEVMSDLLAGGVELLALLVISFEVARRWGREAAWFRFATVFCWCQWAGPMALLGLLLAMSLMLAAGVAAATAAVAGLVGLAAYGLWLHWFIARHALSLSAPRALALVAVTHAATMALILLPQLAQLA